MGNPQNPSGNMTPSGIFSSLKVPCIAAVAVLFVLWSILSLDRHSSSLHEIIVQYKDGSSTITKIPASSSDPPYQYDEGNGNSIPVSERPLILFAYSESDFARINLKFFVDHGLHGAADFIFILNGDTNVEKKIIPRDKENIRVIHRKNDCYDLGAHAEVLQKDDLYKGYKKFILMNASIRGPFVPHWSKECWSDTYLNKLTDEVKLVGMTSNCWPTFHIQSMIWATDIYGLEVLLHPPQHALDYFQKHPMEFPRGRYPPLPGDELQLPGINNCFHTWETAVAAEVGSTALVRAAGYKVDVIMAAFHGNKEYEKGETCKKNGDVLFEGKYWGTNVHPFETLFMKSHREMDEITLDMHTQWVDGNGYSSWDVCKS